MTTADEKLEAKHGSTLTGDGNASIVEDFQKGSQVVRQILDRGLIGAP